jgi:hypothetical protein
VFIVHIDATPPIFSHPVSEPSVGDGDGGGGGGGGLGGLLAGIQGKIKPLSSITLHTGGIADYSLYSSLLS